MIWFLIWLAFTGLIVWLFARSLRTVMRQQRAWDLFARKHNMTYQRPLWYKAPVLEGVIKGRRMRLYVEEYLDTARRMREFRTTIEVYFNNSFPTGLAIGSNAYHELLRGIENVSMVRLPVEMEFSGLMALGRDTGVAMDYIEDHIAPLKAFFGIPKSERLLMGHEADGFMIIQGAEPLDDVKDLNARIKLLFGIVEDLEPLEYDAYEEEGIDDDVIEAEETTEEVTEEESKE